MDDFPRLRALKDLVGVVLVLVFQGLRSIFQVLFDVYSLFEGLWRGMVCGRELWEAGVLVVDEVVEVLVEVAIAVVHVIV